MVSNSTQYENQKFSIVECKFLKIVSFFLMVIMFLSIVSNSFLLVYFRRSKKLQKPINSFVIALTILNLYGSMTELPITITNLYSCR